MHGTSVAMLVLLLASLAPAQEIWVDATRGADTNSGSASQPMRSIAAALRGAGPNTTVFVRAGVYSQPGTNEFFPLDVGVSTDHTGLVLYGIGDVVVDMLGIAGQAMRIGRNADRARITGITFRNMGTQSWWSDVIEAGTFQGLGSSADVEIDRCRFIDVNRGIVLWQGVPITGWRIHNNLFLDLKNDGINEFDARSDNEIFNNTFAGNLHIGVTVEGDLTRVVNNLFVGQRVGISGAGQPAAAIGRVVLNDFFQNTRDAEGAAFAGGLPPGNLFVDPQLVDRARGDLRLRASSPLIDAGLPWPARADLAGVSGSVDGNLDGFEAPDIGCYESTPLLLTASAPGNVLSFRLDAPTAPNLLGVVLFGLDDGVIRVPGLSPILIDPALVVAPAYVGALPLAASGALTATPPPGARIVLQGFGITPALGDVGGPQVRLQW